MRDSTQVVWLANTLMLGVLLVHLLLFGVGCWQCLLRHHSRASRPAPDHRIGPQNQDQGVGWVQDQG